MHKKNRAQQKRLLNHPKILILFIIFTFNKNRFVVESFICIGVITHCAYILLSECDWLSVKSILDAYTAFRERSLNGIVVMCTSIFTNRIIPWFEFMFLHHQLVFFSSATFVGFSFSCAVWAFFIFVYIAVLFLSFLCSTQCAHSAQCTRTDIKHYPLFYWIRFCQYFFGFIYWKCVYSFTATFITGARFLTKPNSLMQVNVLSHREFIFFRLPFFRLTLSALSN